MQKTATDFQYLGPDWRKNCEEEALLGVDITGHADCPLLRFGAPGRATLLRKLRAEVDRVDQELSARFGVKRSAANTCVKPSGDSAAFFNCGSGVSPWFGEYVHRWVREQVGSPVAQLLEAEGVPHFPAPEDPGLVVFGFLRKAPPGATTRKQMTALDQLNNWLEWKENWAEHSVACTIYVDDDEWPDVTAWCYRNFDKITGLSFLPRDNGIYELAPNIEVDAARYAELEAAFPTINWAKLPRFEAEDMTTVAQEYACTSGACSF
jgi:ribonucleoside-diphosphate reductase alpha chain